MHSMSPLVFVSGATIKFPKPRSKDVHLDSNSFVVIAPFMQAPSGKGYEEGVHIKAEQSEM